MRLRELSSLPSQAGSAELNWNKDAVEPYRNGKRIDLPFKPKIVEFFPLKQGEQFLFAYDSPVGLNRGQRNSQVFFGGTDEQPFFVRLQPKALENYLEGGEEAFFKSLKPDPITKLEEITGVSTRRQGDIFALPLNVDWSDFGLFHFMLRGEVAEPRHRDGFSVFGTRHVLNGLIAENGFSITHGLGTPGRNSLLAEGTIQAPDHESQKLHGVHLLLQAELLFAPLQAD